MKYEINIIFLAALHKAMGIGLDNLSLRERIDEQEKLLIEADTEIRVLREALQ